MLVHMDYHQEATWAKHDIKHHEGFSVQHGRQMLSSNSSSKNYTDHESFTINAETGSAIAIYFILAAMANSAGIGGGLFWAPLFNALLGFSVRAAAAMSQSCVATGTVGATLFSVMQRNPADRSRPMIDYPLALILMPALIMGISFGVILNVILPSVIISSLLVLLLLLVSSRTLYRGFHQLKSERLAKKRMSDELDRGGRGIESRNSTETEGDLESGNAAGSSESPTSPHVLGKKDNYYGYDSSDKENNSVDYYDTQNNSMNKAEKTSLDEKASLESYEETEKKKSEAQGEERGGPSLMQRTSSKLAEAVSNSLRNLDGPILPWKYIAEILSLAVAFLGLQIGKTFFSKCSWEYYVMLAAQLLLTVGCSAIFIWLQTHPPPVHAHASRQAQQEGDNDSGEEHHNVGWESFKLALFWIIVLILGVLGGAVGLGGGVLVTPLLLELHVHPQTAAATSTTITLFASTLATVAFGLDGRLNLEYVAVYAPICLVGGFIGVFLLSGLIRKYKITAIVSLLLGFLVLLSAGLVIGFGLRESIQALVDGEPLQVSSLCSS